MRFVLFDRVTQFEAGRRIEGVKCITASEDAFAGPLTRRAAYPPALVLEAMVQLLAWTAIAQHGFTVSVVLGGVDDVVLPPDLAPGTRLHLVGELQGTNPRGSVGRAHAEVDGQVVARVGRALYGHVGPVDADVMRARFAWFGGPV
jgi:3-hydroxyacyl-[acyl-carrier-protein] dehydratase